MNIKAKLRPFYVAKMLYEQTDEDHYLTIAQIMEQLEKEYGISTSRGTVGDAVREEWVALQQAIIDGHIDNLPKRHHIRPNRVVAVVLFHSQEQLEVRDECRSKLFERNVADLVPLFDELREVFIHGTVFPIAAQAFEFADLLLVILVMLAEYGEQRLVVHTQS